MVHHKGGTPILIDYLSGTNLALISIPKEHHTLRQHFVVLVDISFYAAKEYLYG